LLLPTAEPTASCAALLLLQELLQWAQERCSPAWQKPWGITSAQALDAPPPPYPAPPQPVAPSTPHSDSERIGSSDRKQKLLADLAPLL